jgi:signal peptidase I
MEPTVLVGDYLYIRKNLQPFPPPRGDLIVYESVEEPGLKVLKRVVGLPGDTLAMAGGVLWLDGHPVTEPYVQHRDPSKTEEPLMRDKMQSWQLPHLIKDSGDYAPDISDWGPLVVAPESLFVLGDNRENSYDSRYTSFVPYANVWGYPRMVYFSLGPADESKGRTIRWGRMGVTF